MTLTTTIRRGAYIALVAALAATLTLLATAGRSEGAQQASSPQSSARASALRSGMDRLWQEHIVWTRMVIVDFAAGLPDLKTAEARLLRNQTDIGNAIKPYYGNAAGDKLTSLLRTHILEAVPVLEVRQKSGLFHRP